MAAQTATAAIALLLTATAAEAQPAFKLAQPGYEFVFPRDHGSHPEFRTEWWYFTGHLHTSGGKRYGFEVTFFRVGIEPPGTPAATQWDLQQLMPAHFAITDVSGRSFRYYEKLNRESPFTAGAAVGKLDVFNEGWRLTMSEDGSWKLVAAEGKDALDVTLRAEKPPAVNGRNGISVKASGEGYASHYYSMTRLAVTGSLNGEQVTGQAWMDHEFGSSALRENQQGWDWFSIQLDDGSDLMVYIIRRTDGTPDVTSSGSLVLSDGRVIHLTHDQFRVTPLSSWKSPRSGATYPMDWRVEVMPFGIALRLRPVMREQELVTAGSTRVTYWEGAVDVNGSFRNSPVRGVGYVEMTGYDQAFRAAPGP